MVQRLERKLQSRAMYSIRLYCAIRSATLLPCVLRRPHFHPSSAPALAPVGCRSLYVCYISTGSLLSDKSDLL